MAKVATKKSGGFVGGFIILLIGIIVLWSNEGRTVREQSTINEGLKNYTDISSKKINDKYDGKLIATTGKIDLSEASELKDSKFGISSKAVKLNRVVEMYQWNESCSNDDNDKKACSYEKEWSNKIIDSSNFEKSGHSNPTSMKIESEEFVNDNIKVGAFILPSRLIGSLSYNKTYGNDKLNEQYNNSVEGFKVYEKYITNSENTEEPQIGDLRISYKIASDGEVSMMGVQNDNTLRAYKSKKGKSIFSIRRGSYTGREILESRASVNKTIKWILRIFGTFLVIGGIAALFNPLVSLTNKVPVLGNIVNFSTSLFANVVGLAISLLVIAIAWFRFRPLLSIILIVIIAGLIVFLKMKGVKLPSKNTEKNEK